MTWRFAAVLGLAGSVALGVTPSRAMLQSVGAGEGQVSIVAWPGYVERGDTDKAYDWVTPFEEQTGCKVSVKTAGTSDEMVALMNEGGFDLVTASGDASLRLVAGWTLAIWGGRGRGVAGGVGTAAERVGSRLARPCQETPPCTCPPASPRSS